MNRFLGPAVAALLCLCLMSCASPLNDETAERELASVLRRLGDAVSAEEATLAAETAFSCCLELAGEYRAVRPAVMQNVLVNAGLKRRGLCFHWAEDLSARLECLNLRTLEIHRGAARLGTRREHSALVITARSQPFDDGIVLDGWRHSGRLYWNFVRVDKYPWKRVEVISEPAVEPERR